MAAPELQEFLAVLRGGDGQAVEELLRALGPFIRSTIRLRLIDGRLRRVMDTTDILQSLLRDFLSQREGGPPPAGASTELYAFLAAAVRNKIQTRARKERRHEGSLPDGWETVDPEPPAARQVEDRDFSEAIRARLSALECRLFDLKAQGFTWGEIAAEVGGRPDALRMRLTRAIAAVLGELDPAEARHAR